MTFQINTPPEVKTRLVFLMQNYHVGQRKAIKKRDLLKEVFGDAADQNESYNNMQDRQIRDAINKANEEGALICSSARHGYWWAADMSDGIGAVEENKSRALTQLANVSTLEKNLQREYGGQLGLL